MDDEARKLLDDVKIRNADIEALTANDPEAGALVAVALTKLGEEAVDGLAKEAFGSAALAEEGKALFKLRLRALFPDTGGA
jgi:predicted oxidoreductase